MILDEECLAMPRIFYKIPGNDHGETPNHRCLTSAAIPNRAAVCFIFFPFERGKYTACMCMSET